ncbi:NAD-dependent epimerase/dehydratase family protein [Jannaschia sp. 2305UL9-9]|uniref:NAD-dependent epimerase/dehydratase family protein n=1 Tax=Jannaschia sp. 2305UL9-9 TaxID=3121638 RepID=UPI003527C8BB
MTTLITGAGLIGTRAARLLLDRGEAVVLCDVRAPSALPDGAGFVTCDVTDTAGLSDVITGNGITQIVHCAAVLSTGLRADPVKGLGVNLMGTVNVFDLARTHGIRRVVNISSATVLYSGFGSFGPAPIEEDAPLRNLSEGPASMYALTKQTGEHLGLLYRKLHGSDIVSLRFGAVVGGDGDAVTSVPGRLLHQLVTAARSGTPLHLDDPFLVWDGVEEFIDVRDCAAAIVAALDAQAPTTGVYNIAHPGQHSLDSLSALLRAAYPDFKLTWPEDVRAGFAGFPHTRPAPTATDAARAELGFAAQHDMADTLRHWYRVG